MCGPIWRENFPVKFLIESLTDQNVLIFVRFIKHFVSLQAHVKTDANFSMSMCLDFSAMGSTNGEKIFMLEVIIVAVLWEIKSNKSSTDKLREYSSDQLQVFEGVSTREVSKGDGSSICYIVSCLVMKMRGVANSTSNFWLSILKKFWKSGESLWLNLLSNSQRPYLVHNTSF